MRTTVIISTAILIFVEIAVASVIIISSARSNGREVAQPQEALAAVADSIGQAILPDKSNAEAKPESSGEDGGIIIPGFASLTFRANTLQQRVKFSNPAQNKCYFVLKIILPDGKEIYRSNKIAPNEAIEQIQLNTILPTGTHEDTILQYSCYDMDTLDIMSGASVKFTLEVR